MKKGIRFFGIAVALSAMIMFTVSCTKDLFHLDSEDLIPQPDPVSVKATATLPANNTAKAYFETTAGADFGKVFWQANDQIGINGQAMTIYSGAGTIEADFYGTATPSRPNPEDGKNYFWALYPTSLHSSHTYNSLNVTLPAVQNYDISNTSRLQGYTYMVGYTNVTYGTESLNFGMKNLGAVLCFSLRSSASNKNLDSIVFIHSSNNLSGTFTVSDPTTSISASGTNRVKIDCSNGGAGYITLNNSTCNDVFVVLPPLSSGTLTVLFYNTTGYTTKKTLDCGAHNIVRSNYYKDTFDLAFITPPELGPFTVASGRQVYFSPGNLQWSATGGGTSATTHAVAGGGTAAGTWRFAENQWDFVGNASDGTVYGVGGDPNAKCNNAYISSSCQGWIDVFAWGTSGWSGGAVDYQPYSTSIDQNNFSRGGTFSYDLTGTCANADWGVYNAIYNPKAFRTDAAGTWRTLTKVEWDYLLNTRSTTSGIRYAMATVNSVKGLIIVPDDWDASIYTLNSFNSAAAAHSANTISSSVWINTFEANGCVFLPCAGARQGASGGYHVGTTGLYWSTTSQSHNSAYYLDFKGASNVTPAGYDFRYNGRAVRLVKEVGSSANFNNQPFGVNP